MLKQQQETPASSKPEVKAEPRLLGRNLTKIFEHLIPESTSEEQNCLTSKHSYPQYAAQSCNPELPKEEGKIRFQYTQQKLNEAEKQVIMEKEKLKKAIQLKQELEERIEQYVQKVGVIRRCSSTSGR